MALERQNSSYPSVARVGFARIPFLLLFALLSVEFLDELVDGIRRASWPIIRSDLSLSYTEIGLLLSVPGLVGAAIEVGLGVLGDVWNRRALVIGGGVFFALALALTGLSYSFAALLAATIIFFPAGGAFVNLSQAALMDAAPERREQNMARWTLAGSAANVAGPLALAAAVSFGAGWRELFILTSALTLVVLLLVGRFHFPLPTRDGQATKADFRAGLRRAFGALKRKEVLRWLVLLEIGDLMLDVLCGFLALYFVDVVGVSESKAAFAVLVWTCVGLVGDLLLLPLLERVRGLSYLRVSVSVVAVLFPLFLLASDLTTKLVLLGLLGFANAGWYSILQARLYATLPGQSGTVMSITNIAGFFNYFMPLVLGAFATRFGLDATMWLLLIAPVVLLIGLHRTSET